MYEISEKQLVMQLNDLAKSSRIIFGKYLTTWVELERYEGMETIKNMRR